MLSKLAVAFVATLAATAQAGHVKHHHFAKRHYSDNSTSVAQSATTITLVPTPSSSSASQLGTAVSTVTLVPTPSGSSSVALSTGPSATVAQSSSATLDYSSSVPLSTGPGATIAYSSSATLDHSSSVPLSTGPGATIAYSNSATLDQSISVPLSTGPGATLAHSSSAQQNALSRTSSTYLTTGPLASVFPSSSLSATLNPSSSVPLGTGPRSVVTQQATITGPQSSLITEVPTSVSIITSDSVLTYTVGSGSSTTVVVTTIRRTSTQTVYQTIYATPSSATLEATNAVSDSNEPTTTKRSFITSTAVITVYPVTSGAPGESGDQLIETNVVVCPAPVTVTVPGPQVTVTVTVPAQSPARATQNPVTSPPNSSGVATEDATTKASTVTKFFTAIASPSSPGGANEYNVVVSSSASLQAQITSSVYHNGTLAATSASSGFLTKTAADFTQKPSTTTPLYRPSGTGAYHH